MLLKGIRRAWSVGGIAVFLAVGPGFCAQPGSGSAPSRPAETPAAAAAAAEARQLQAVRQAQADLVLQAFLTAQLLNDSAQAQWAAPPKKIRRRSKRKPGPVIENLATDGDVGFVFAADLSSAEGLSYADEGAEAQPILDFGLELEPAAMETNAAPEEVAPEALAVADSAVVQPDDLGTSTDGNDDQADGLNVETADEIPVTASGDAGDSQAEDIQQAHAAVPPP